MKKLKRHLKRRIARLSKNTDGATAIEFALLALPFFALLFGILELAVIFFISSTLNFAVSEAGRQIRTGSFQLCSQAQFKALVCSNMSGVGDCLSLIHISEPTRPY